MTKATIMNDANGWSDAQTVLPVDDITPCNGALDDEKLAVLSYEISEHGWTDRPLLVAKDYDGSYKAITGTHRYLAAVTNGMTEIPCLVVENLDPFSDDFDVIVGCPTWDAREEALSRIDSDAAELLAEDPM